MRHVLECGNNVKKRCNYKGNHYKWLNVINNIVMAVLYWLHREDKTRKPGGSYKKSPCSDASLSSWDHKTQRCISVNVVSGSFTKMLHFIDTPN